MTDLIIIGAGPAGMTAALYAARAGKSVLMLEKETFGGQITYSPRVENYPGIKQISGNEWASGLVEQILDLGVRTELETVTGIRPDGPRWIVETMEGIHIGRALILATGVSHRRLGLPREEDLMGAGLSTCAVCDGAFYAGEDTAVVGGGDTALQEALFLSGEFRGEHRLQEALHQRDNVELRLHSIVSALEGTDSLTGVTLQDTRSGVEEHLAVTGLFVAIGQLPHNEAFASVVRLDESGYILAGEDRRLPCQGGAAADHRRGRRGGRRAGRLPVRGFPFIGQSKTGALQQCWSAPVLVHIPCYFPEGTTTDGGGIDLPAFPGQKD